VAIPAIEEATVAKYQQSKKAEAKSKTEIIGISGKTGTCECCGEKGVPKDKLLKIDSGQLFCPNCLHALKSSGVS
jgi:transposase